MHPGLVASRPLEVRHSYNRSKRSQYLPKYPDQCQRGPKNCTEIRYREPQKQPHGPPQVRTPAFLNFHLCLDNLGLRLGNLLGNSSLEGLCFGLGGFDFKVNGPYFGLDGFDLKVKGLYFGLDRFDLNLDFSPLLR